MRLRISKPLLRIIVEHEHLVEVILTGGNDTLSEGVLPEGIVLSDLLRTCRRYDADTQEAVQLVSLLVSLHAWLVMESRPDADAPTLLTLRPGAAVLGSGGRASRMLTSLAAAAAAVDAAGTGKEGSSRTEARQKAALKEGFRLVARTQTPLPGTAALSPNNTQGSDAVICFAEGVYHGQCKGRATGPAAGTGGGDAKVSPSHLLAYLGGLNKSAGDEHPACLELLLAGRASAGVQSILAGSMEPDFAAKLSETLGADDCAIVMTREHLADALGVSFGGIAARCMEQGAGEKMADKTAEKTARAAKKAAKKKPA